jgi:hypothetical protein
MEKLTKIYILIVFVGETPIISKVFSTRKKALDLLYSVIAGGGKAYIITQNVF